LRLLSVAETKNNKKTVETTNHGLKTMDYFTPSSVSSSATDQTRLEDKSLMVPLTARS
jgi:hypothetical protein